jgi:AcrR family transcriptional regulator
MSDSARDRIVAAAGELFARDGIKASGVNAIIAASGVAKATFYRQFRSKDDLVAAWLESSITPRVDEMLATIEASAPTPAERLDLMFDGITERLGANDFAGFPFVSAAMELEAGPSPVRDLVQSQLADTRTVLTELAASAGAPDAEACARQVQLLLLGLLIRVRAEPDARVEAGRSARDAARRLLGLPPHPLP